MEQKNIEAFLRKAPSKKKRSTRKSGKKPSEEKRDLGYYEGVLKMYREIGHQEGIVETLIEMALLHAENDSLLKAIESAERARNISEELEDPREVTALLLLGDLRYRTRDPESAEELWLQSTDHPMAETEQILGGFLRLAWRQLESGTPGFSDWLDRSDAIARSHHASLLRSIHARRSGDLHQAEEWMSKAIATQDGSSSPALFAAAPVLPSVEESDLHRTMGDILLEIGRVREAASAYERAGDHLAQGDAFRELGNMELALSAYERGKKKTSQGIFVIRIAEIRIEMGDEEGALTLLERSEKELIKKEPHLAIEALDLRILVCSGRDRARERVRMLEQKGAVYETLEEYQGMTDSLLQAAELYQGMDDDESWKRGVKVLQQVINSEAKRGKIREELQLRSRLEKLHLERDRPVKRIYEDNVEYCYSLKKPMLAIAFFQGELELHKGKEEEFLDYLHLARSFLSAGKRTEALATYQEAAKRYKEPGIRGTIHREIGYLFRIMGDMEKARKSLDKASSNFKRARNREGQVRALCELEKLYDDEISREKMVRSKHISEINKVTNRMEKLTEENNDCQKIIRETSRLVDEKETEIREKREHLEKMRLELPENGPDRTKQLSMMEKLRKGITKIEESMESLNRTIRENQAKKLTGQEERADLKQSLTELKKQDATMKRKIEAIEATGATFREQAMKMDPMLATSAKLETIEEDIYHSLASGTIPQIRIPTRTKDNIEFSDAQHVYRYGSGLSFRSAKSTDGANMLMRTAYVIDFIDDMINTSLKGKNRSSTLRELYYISESWGKLAKFGSQNESNNLIEDLEIITRYMRENFHLRPEEDGARVIGNVTLREKNRKGEWKNINCRNDVGDSGYTIPYNAEKEKLKFKSVDADFVIAIETGGMFDRLVENGFDEDARAVLVHIKGQPARSTRRFLKRLNEETRLPVLVFTDGDPWSYRIFASIAYGAIKTAHISHHLATPSAEYVGITPSDILTYELPTDKLSDRDVEALNSELTDPRFSDGFWQEEISTQLKIKKKSEQQALAKYGLDFVTETYLPEKLGEMGYLS